MENTEQEAIDTTTGSVSLEERKSSAPLVDDGSTHENLMNLFNQLNTKARTVQERKQIEMLKQLMPLYQKHDFWDTQPVPSSMKG